jgi:hypothetical protein
VILVAKSLAGTPVITLFVTTGKNKGTIYFGEHGKNIFTHQARTEKPTAIELVIDMLMEATNTKIDPLRLL